MGLLKAQAIAVWHAQKSAILKIFLPKKADTESRTNCEFQMHLQFQDLGVEILCDIKVSGIKNCERVCHFMSLA